MSDTLNTKRSTTRPVFLLVDTTVLAWLALAVGGLGLAHLGVLAAVYGLGIEDGWGVVTLFHLDREQNIPSLFSGLALGLASLIVLMSAKTKTGDALEVRARWLLSAALLFLALDEWVSIHERLDAFMKTLGDFSGALSHAWVLPYGIGLVACLVVLLPWGLRQSRAVQFSFAAAVAVYAAGALGCEVLHACYIAGDLPQSVPVTPLGGDLIATLEEMLELTGLLLLIGASFRLLAESGGPALVMLASSRNQAEPKE